MATLVISMEGGLDRSTMVCALVGSKLFFFAIVVVPQDFGWFLRFVNHVSFLGHETTLMKNETQNERFGDKRGILSVWQPSSVCHHQSDPEPLGARLDPTPQHNNHTEANVSLCVS